MEPHTTSSKTVVDAPLIFSEFFIIPPGKGGGRSTDPYLGKSAQKCTCEAHYLISFRKIIFINFDFTVEETISHYGIRFKVCGLFVKYG